MEYFVPALFFGLAALNLHMLYTLNSVGNDLIELNTQLELQSVDTLKLCKEHSNKFQESLRQLEKLFNIKK